MLDADVLPTAIPDRLVRHCDVLYINGPTTDSERMNLIAATAGTQVNHYRLHHAGRHVR